MDRFRFQVLCFLWLSIAGGLVAPAAGRQRPAPQTAPQSPSPMVDHTRPHPRIPQMEAAGRRIELKALKGARLFLGPRFNPNRAVPLLVHFHGAPWLIELHVARHLPRAALVTVQLGSGSSVYRRPFQTSDQAADQADAFQNLVGEAAREAGLKQGWSSITLSGFSAGYGAVREILRHPKDFALVNNALLLDGLHTSYEPEGRLLADGGKLEAIGLDSFVAFAKEAAAGRKTFVVTHSEIFPGAYASTTECAEYLLAQLSLRRRAELRQGPIGMQQLSAVDLRGMHLRGYAGNAASDHVDQLQAMPAWFRLLRIK